MRSFILAILFCLFAVPVDAGLFNRGGCRGGSCQVQASVKTEKGSTVTKSAKRTRCGLLHRGHRGHRRHHPLARLFRRG